MNVTTSGKEFVDTIILGEELTHHGIKGQKWGIRRFQNKNGSLTPAGRKRYDDDDDESDTLSGMRFIPDDQNSLKKALSKRKTDKQRKEALEKARATRAANKKAEEEKQKAEAARQKKLAEGKLSSKEMTADELKERIAKMELEKKYDDLMKSQQGKTKASKGKAFVGDVLEKSGKNIATQLTTYVMGVGVNKALEKVFDDKAVINPKKGQKDK